jgi:5-methylcytosine-specific restriction endonuclease McrA
MATRDIPTMRFPRPNSYRFVVSRKYDQRPDRKADHRFYASAAWMALRAHHLAVNPTCETCGNPATIAHHKIPRHVAPHLSLEPSNIESSCPRCHNRTHHRT